MVLSYFDGTKPTEVGHPIIATADKGSEWKQDETIALRRHIVAQEQDLAESHAINEDLRAYMRLQAIAGQRLAEVLAEVALPALRDIRDIEDSLDRKEIAIDALLKIEAILTSKPIEGLPR